MSMWQAPSTNNERAPDDIGTVSRTPVRPYLASDGFVRWWKGNDALSVGATPLFMVVRAADGMRIFSTDDANEREPILFGTSDIHIR